MKVVTVEQMRQLEAAIDESLFSYQQLMQAAGQSAADYLSRRLDVNAQTTITFLIGKGNNGGDGLVMAHELASRTAAQIRLYLLEARNDGNVNFAAVSDDGLFVANATDDHDMRLLKSMISSSDVVVDALFGIGLRLPLRGTAAKLLRTVNLLVQHRPPEEDDLIPIDGGAVTGPQHGGRPFVFAIDCPSGINCDTGQADTNALQADETITFIAAKTGLFTFPAAKYVGELLISSLGIPASFPELKRIQRSIVDRSAAVSMLPERPVDGHKGTFGKLMIVAGCPNYIGAISLAAESAYRSGVGLVTVATSEDLVKVVAGNLREPTYLPLPQQDGAIAETSDIAIKNQSHGYNALLVGCGLGRHHATASFVANLLNGAPLPSLVLDADALNILSAQDSWWAMLPAETVITPHIGELARLSALSTREITANRWEVAAQKSAEWNVTLVLKGAHTLIAAPYGRVSVVPFKTDALGTAGTGDVLAGLIAGLWAQGLTPFDSACLGAYVHALAGIIARDHVGSSRSVIAGDVLAYLGLAFKKLESA